MIMQILESSPLGNLYLWNQIAYNVSWPIPANNQTYYDYIKHWSAGPLGTSTTAVLLTLETMNAWCLSWFCTVMRKLKLSMKC